MDQIPCPECKGTGRTSIPKALAQTLAQLRKACRQQPGGIRVGALHRLLSGDFGLTAVHERLESLRALGFADRAGDGRRGAPYRYFPTQPKNTT